MVPLFALNNTMRRRLGADRRSLLVALGSGIADIRGSDIAALLPRPTALAPAVQGIKIALGLVNSLVHSLVDGRPLLGIPIRPRLPAEALSEHRLADVIALQPQLRIRLPEPVRRPASEAAQP